MGIRTISDIIDCGGSEDTKVIIVSDNTFILTKEEAKALYERLEHEWIGYEDKGIVVTQILRRLGDFVRESGFDCAVLGDS